MFTGQPAHHDRFATSVAPLDLPQLIRSAIPQKTKEKAQWAYRVFCTWTAWYQENNSDEICTVLQNKLSEMSDLELDLVLSAFIQQARNQQGTPYPGKTLYEIITSIQKHLELEQKTVSLIDKEKFQSLYYSRP
jgi:hypothetical protein